MAPVPDTGNRVDLDAILTRLRQRVEQRRAEGDYPEDLEHKLDRHFRRLASQRGRREPPAADIEEELDRLDAAGHFSPERISVDADSPLRRNVHELTAKLAGRQVQGVLEQMQQFGDLTRSVLRLQWTALRVLEQRQATLEHRIDSALDKLERYERGGDAPPEIVLKELQEQLRTLAEWEERTRFAPWYSSEDFEEEFRGSKEDVKDSYRDLAALFGEGPVLDIGFGRGEFLELLGERGIEAVGVEVDRALVDGARESGLDVHWGDGLDMLAGYDDATLGGIFLGQVIEHLTQQQLLDLVAEAARVLKPGGLFIADTVNPQSLYVYAHSFYIDPTHVRPVHPSYMLFLLKQAGFAQTGIDWRSPVPPDDILQSGDADAERINRILFASQDYAVVGRR
jgi:SAM-dependent methyltransferase